MSAATPAGAQQGAFEFTAENLERARRIIGRYPPGRQASAVMPLLDLAQRQNGNWVSRAVMDYIADLLEMPRMRVYEVATFYTMYNKRPVGRHFVQVCTNVPCMLRGSDDIVKACERKLGIRMGGTTDDGQFSLVEVECMGACVNAPMVQIGDDYFEDLTPERMEEILDMLARGEVPPAGSQTGRHTSMPATGPTTLIEHARKAGVIKAEG